MPEIKNILLVGYGKMGQMTAQYLIPLKNIEHLCIVDPHVKEEESSSKVTFLNHLEDLNPTIKFDCAFIITPAKTHYTVLCQIINFGIKNIFIEKPSVCTREDLSNACLLGKNCKIVVGYILRHSGILNSFCQTMKKLQQNGYLLEHVDVVYVKNKILPNNKKSDFGVFEEIYHIWDLLFSYLKFGQADSIILKKNYFEIDPLRNDRYIAGSIEYLLLFKTQKVRISIKSSFKDIKKKREFKFFFVNQKGQKKQIVLEFDGTDSNDKITLFNEQNLLVYQKKSPSLSKLPQQIKRVFRYFDTGLKNNRLHTLDESCILEMIRELTLKSQKGDVCGVVNKY